MLNRLFDSARSVVVTGLLATCVFFQSSCSRTPAALLDHGITFQYTDSGREILTIPRLSSGGVPSILIAGVGRGDAPAFGNTEFMPAPDFELLDSYHPYTEWPNSGTATYFRAVTSDMAELDVRVGASPGDEVTVAALIVAGTRISDYSWTEVLEGPRVTSKPIRTNGPATLIAFWWGDAGVNHHKVAMPGNGFRIVDSVLFTGPLVQCAVAVREVDQAGEYFVDWNAFPKQGAQLWLIAVE